MDDKIIDLLKLRPIVIPRILLNNYRLFNITDSEFIVIMVLLSYGDKITYNPEEFAREVRMSKHEVMSIIDSLCDKNIISLVVEKVNKKTYEYLSMELLYQKLFNIVANDDKSEKEEIDNSIFSVFEKELGRTLSPMEFEQIKEWITSGNSNELIICALREAVLNGVGNLRYIDSILNDWRKKGYRKQEDVKKDREIYRSKKSKVEVFDTDWLND
ncbi:MAG: DnaD domain protein [Erysipelotrichaceae bacterium]|nr:DnaD domain protein [Erysipelotrichaceae bacterium]MDY3934830.1 DnaD domain protein [Bacilli bacterium]